MHHAQVTQGGVSVQGMNPATLQTNIPGLYMAGEMLDVDGDTGGFNLMFAFACGFLAGENVQIER
jgi:predicted flavoprotein YhiN